MDSYMLGLIGKESLGGQSNHKSPELALLGSVEDTARWKIKNGNVVCL